MQAEADQVEALAQAANGVAPESDSKNKKAPTGARARSIKTPLQREALEAAYLSELSLSQLLSACCWGNLMVVHALTICKIECSQSVSSRGGAPSFRRPHSADRKPSAGVIPQTSAPVCVDINCLTINCAYTGLVFSQEAQGQEDAAKHRSSCINTTSNQCIQQYLLGIFSSCCYSKHTSSSDCSCIGNH